MSTTMQTLGLVLAGVVVILAFVSVSVTGAILGAASPLNFAIYLGLGMTAAILALIVYMSLGRTGHVE